MRVGRPDIPDEPPFAAPVAILTEDSVNFECGARSCPINSFVGEWLSLVEHLVRDQGVGGSNPLSPTNFLCGLAIHLVLLLPAFDHL